MPFPFSTSVAIQTYTFRDAKGNTSTMKFFLDFTATTVESASTSAGTILSALTPLTNAAVQSLHGPATEYGVAQYGAHVANGAYESIIEKAVMVFQDASGQLHRFQVPAPKVSIFKADKVTVDPANASVMAFIAAITGLLTAGVFVCTRQDIGFSNYMGGVYRSAKLRRRLNILVLEPDLTGSLPAE